MLESCFGFRSKKGNDVRKHLSRNIVAIATNDTSRSVTFSYEMRQLRVYRRTLAKSCWKVRANVPPCRGKLAFLRTRRAGRGRCCFRRNSQTYGFALLDFSAVDAVPDATDDIIRFSPIWPLNICSFYGALIVHSRRDSGISLLKFFNFPRYMIPFVIRYSSDNKIRKYVVYYKRNAKFLKFI